VKNIIEIILFTLILGCSITRNANKLETEQCKKTINQLAYIANIGALTIDSCLFVKDDKMFVTIGITLKYKKKYHSLIDNNYKVVQFDILDSLPNYKVWVDVNDDSIIQAFEHRARNYNQIVSGGLHKFNVCRKYNNLTIIGFLSVSDSALKNGIYLDPYVDLVFDADSNLLSIGRFYF
jgi:hypothetical protein